MFHGLPPKLPPARVRLSIYAWTQLDLLGIPQCGLATISTLGSDCMETAGRASVIIEEEGGLATRDALSSLGFLEDWEAMTDRRPGYKLTVGRLKLSASEVMSQYFKPIFLMAGVFHDARRIASIEFEMPLELDSLDQAKAWIAYGTDLRPGDVAIPWLSEGHALRHLLPWERAQRRYQSRPNCSVPRPWMRLATAQLRTMALQAGPDEECEVIFDGVLLSFKAGTCLVPLSAQGKRPWPESYRIRLADLARLPKRLMDDPVGVDVWDGQLGIGRYRVSTL